MSSRLRLLKHSLAIYVAILIATAYGVTTHSLRRNQRQNDSEATYAFVNSDNTHVPITQPFLKATDWFLTEQEITDSRGGKPRKDLSVYTSGNAIKSFTVSKDFFDSVYTDLSAIGEGCRVLLTAWESRIVPLKPDVDVRGTKSGYVKVLRDAVKRGGEINILAWAHIIRPEQNIEARDLINSIPASPINGARATYIFDDRVPYISSSHHQKSIVMAATQSSGLDEHPIAYVGGIEITKDRWDTIDHDNSPLRDAAGITYQYNGWIDGEIRIHGPAAKDVANNFLARWNSDEKPCIGLDDDLLNFKNPKFKKLPPLHYTSSNTTSQLGKKNVQIVRTFSCKSKQYKRFAPHGEISLLRARVKAIKKAKNYIYIEDQYFIFVPELFNALMDAMPRLQKVIVVAQSPTGVKYAGYEKYFYDMVSPLKKKYPTKFKVYTTKLDLKIYIHSKIVIIDDVYVSIGSANWNRRSMTSDSELNANVVDDHIIQSPDGVLVNEFARHFRIRKFQEMTGVLYNELDAMTFLDAAKQFDVAAAKNNSLLQELDAEYYLYYIVTDIIREQVDPEDICF
ncbi:hypothetical protein PsorP6_007741 [Peronosclerospora sorghi]|uniref:Uncharacterized protein n=1 Tax=Peronosclerospora sorghi TaxID=230839 RepID=A0ACC0W7W8_9STRA|nr:hypothetical protein PsorP6_007741 [Peronosclerospora sorghi]